LPMLTWIMFLKFLDDLELSSAKARPGWPRKSSRPPSNHPTAGAIGLPRPTA